MTVDPAWGCVIGFDQLKPHLGQGPVWRWIHCIGLTKQILQLKNFEISVNTCSNQSGSMPVPAFPWLPQVQMQVGFFAKDYLTGVWQL